jgi:hypothetical protein
MAVNIIPKEKTGDNISLTVGASQASLDSTLAQCINAKNDANTSAEESQTSADDSQTSADSSQAFAGTSSSFADASEASAEASELSAIRAEEAGGIYGNHGISEGCIFTINGSNANAFDISTGAYWIDGTKYTFAGATNVTSLGNAGDYASVGLDSSGLIHIPSNFIDLDTAETTLEITAYAKFTDTTIDVIGDSRDDVSSIMKDFFLRMKYFEETKFKNGGGKITLSSTPAQLNIEEGVVSAPNGKRVEIPQMDNIGANAIYHTAGVESIHPTVTPYVVDLTLYDNYTDLVAIPSEKFTAHTLARSIRTGANYFAFGHELFDNLGEAQTSEPDLGIFQGTQEGSFIEPLAMIIVREGVNAIYNIVDVRGGKEANTIDSIAGKTIHGMVSGDVLKYDGTQIVAETPTSNAGQGVSYFLGNNIISGGNYDLTIFPAGGAEVEVQQTASASDSPKFIERYVSDAVGGSSIDAGAWTINTYASVDSNQGTSEIIARVNKSVLKTGTLTSTGTGLTRTFTASEAGTFVAGDADTSILDATLIQTPTETFWIDTFVSDTEVTATTDQAGYVNETGVSFSMFYKLFESTTGDIGGSDPALYETKSVQGQFAINPTDKLLVAYFLNVTSGSNKTVSLYKNGNENYSHIITPLIYRHNSLGGLNEDDYQHLTETEKVNYDAYDTRITDLEGNTGSGQMLGDAEVKAISYNAQVIDEDITITTGLNAYSVGTVTLEDGRTITIEDGAEYKLL